MATFADFALLRTLPTYGGAEVLRARRVRQNGEDPPVHLALYGEPGKLERRLIAVADAAAATAHEQVARILEVGTSEGSLYAAAVPVDGVDVAAVLDYERRKKSVPDLAFSLATSAQLGQIALDLQEAGDVFATDAGAGLSSLFPAGLRLDALVLGRDGKLSIRILAGAAADPAKPSAFRAPELRNESPSASSDVFISAQVMRALLTGDASATSAPRFQPGAGHLGKLLAGALMASAEERLGLFILVERINDELARLAGKTPADAVCASFLKREYRAILPEETADLPITAAATSLRARLKQARGELNVLWPVSDKAKSSLLSQPPQKPVKTGTHELVMPARSSPANMARPSPSKPSPPSPGKPPPKSAPPPPDISVEAPSSFEEQLNTTLMPSKPLDTSSAIDRVFDDGGVSDDDDMPITVPIKREDLEQAVAATISERSNPAVRSGPPPPPPLGPPQPPTLSPPAPPQLSGPTVKSPPAPAPATSTSSSLRAPAPVTLVKERPVDMTSESDPPWISMEDDFALVQSGPHAINAEASGAPVPNADDAEAGPTIQMKTMRDDSDLPTDDQASDPTKGRAT